MRVVLRVRYPVHSQQLGGRAANLGHRLVKNAVRGGAHCSICSREIAGDALR